jgi:hypothetical protein
MIGWYALLSLSRRIEQHASFATGDSPCPQQAASAAASQSPPARTEPDAGRAQSALGHAATPPAATAGEVPQPDDPVPAPSGPAGPLPKGAER